MPQPGILWSLLAVLEPIPLFARDCTIESCTWTTLPTHTSAPPHLPTAAPERHIPGTKISFPNVALQFRSSARLTDRSVSHNASFLGASSPAGLYGGAYLQLLI